MLKRLAALSAALAIAAGAFGAHVAQGQSIEWLKTGALYQLVHAVAVLVVGPSAPRQAALMLGGSLVFALSLYLMAAGGPRWLGAVTPVGGVMMIGGWVWLAAGKAR